MIELVQFRKRVKTTEMIQTRDLKRTVTEFRHAQVLADPAGHLLVVTDEDGKVQYDQWQEVKAQD